MKISDIMTGHVVAASQKEPITAAARLMKRHNLGVLPVCDDRGNLRGVVTDRDIVTRCIAAELPPEDTPLREIMTRGIRTCSPEDDAGAALSLMCREQIRRLPIVEEGKLVGMVSLGDVARSRSHSMEAAEALAEISSNIRHGE